MFIFALLVTLSTAFIFEVPTNGFRCISEEGFDKERLAGIYSIPENEDSQYRTLALKIFRGKDNREELFSGVFDPDHGEQQFGAVFSGDFDSLDICVIDSADRRNLQPVKVEIRFENIVVKKFAGKEKIGGVAEKVETALTASQTLKDYVDKCKHLYDTRRGINEKTNSVTMWFAIFIMIIVVASTVYQVTSLKRFFLRRKMI